MRWLKTLVAMAGLVTTMVGGIAPAASAASAECSQTVISISPPDVSFGTVECTCPPPPTHMDVQVSRGFIVITSCISN